MNTHCSGNALARILAKDGESVFDVHERIKINHDDVLCGSFKNCFDYVHDSQMLYNFDIHPINEGRIVKLVDCPRCIAVMKKHGV